MTDHQLINAHIERSKEDVRSRLEQLAHLTRDLGHTDIIDTIQDLIAQVDTPFTFVVVGEVKSGKSSFINALLDTGVEICKAAPHPMTDTIQLIVYGEVAKEISLNPYLKRIEQPVDLLRDISIVDTPGTNTIVAHHQEITERFIPSSDLIIFVFEAKNPYRQSAWNFFDYIHEQWRRKVIFVLQQKDLLPEADLQINIEGVIKQAQDKGIDTPLVYAVSALMEWNKDPEDSGYKPIRNYIREHITGGNAPILKLNNSLSTARQVLHRIEEGVSLRRQQYDIDQQFLTDSNQLLDEQYEHSDRQIDILLENLLAGYDQAAEETEVELSSTLTIGSLVKRSWKSIWSRSENTREWLEGLIGRLENRLHNEMERRLNTSVQDLADSIQQMAMVVDLKIKNHQSVLPLGHEFFNNIAEERNRVITELQDNFQTFIRAQENFSTDDMAAKYQPLSSSITTGGGIAIIGVVLSSLTKIMVLDIAGGLLTAVGVVFAGVTIGWNRRKIISGYRQAIEDGRAQIRAQIQEVLQEYAATIRQRIDGNFNGLRNHLYKEEQALKELEQRIRTIRQALDRPLSDLSK